MCKGNANKLMPVVDPGFSRHGAKSQPTTLYLAFLRKTCECEKIGSEEDACSQIPLNPAIA